MPADFEIRKDSKQEWYWTFQANNNKTICKSTDGYKNRADCIASIKLIKELGPSAPVWDMTTDPISKVFV